MHRSICTQGNVSFALVLWVMLAAEDFYEHEAEVGVHAEGLLQGEKAFSQGVLLVGKKMKHLALFGLVT